jgi:epsilon-lactone hydrolase
MPKQLRGPSTASTRAEFRNLFLTVRTQRKLREAGVEAQLQVFEGMSHA